LPGTIANVTMHSGVPPLITTLLNRWYIGPRHRYAADSTDDARLADRITQSACTAMTTATPAQTRCLPACSRDGVRSASA
jgi:hypothetical protein